MRSFRRSPRSAGLGFALAALALGAAGDSPPEPGLVRVEAGSNGAVFQLGDQPRYAPGLKFYADPKSLVPGTNTVRMIDDQGRVGALNVYDTKNPEKLINEIRNCQNHDVAVPGSPDASTLPPPAAPAFGGGGASTGGGAGSAGSGDAINVGSGSSPGTGAGGGNFGENGVGQYYHPVPPGRHAPAGNPLEGRVNTGSVLETAIGSNQIAEAAQGLELVNAGRSIRELVETTARSDQEAVSAPYRSLPLEAMETALERAAKTLVRSAEALGSAVGGFDSSEAQRFRLSFLNASDKAAAGAEALREDRTRSTSLSGQSPFTGLLAPGGKGGNPLARTPLMRDIFGGPGTDDYQKSATSNEGLVNRMILFGGLSDQDRARVGARMKFLEKPTLTLRDGRKETIAIPHNGYLFGAGKTGLDCSSFVSSLLPAEVGKTRYTTLDFLTMWSYRRTGVFPKPPTYVPAQAERVRRAADAFLPVNFYEGDRPAIGDLLVYRVPWETAGHVFLVRGFNPSTMNVEVLEAAQSAGTVREREFSLSTSPPSAPKKTLRAGIFGLRLKPIDNSVCRYNDGKKSSKLRKSL